MKKVKKNEETKMKSVDQLTIARLVSGRTGLSLADVQEVIELEQKLTMDYIKRGWKVIKKNYITLTPTYHKGKQLLCPLNGKTYDLPNRRGVSVRVGTGFKSYISDNVVKMPDKMCRFVDGTETVKA